ncbi:hypothetical protein L3556_03150 [Candidatus Synechococcus calcipolaris G9]|uniref:Uncharacterized protein n=1 Tax=Candidatus Synechococcus calcipolaris G9 TaxID=1497997 RepID=A0ABT6EVX4_9SYNE|nr:hypothetical protein [Candidatus Synechococcus calcipolaris]MDG2989935.1 hypothetical protein [Candidatus Synechococcus calcipolaris G9]
MSWLLHHTRSEEYVSQAEQFSRQREINRAVELYRLAAEAETRALDNLDVSKARTIGITAVSAVSLYYRAKEFALAKRIAHKWLATEFLPSFAIDDLEDLLQVIRYEESRAKSGIQFIEGEVLVSVSGGEILYGAAPLELILHKVERIRSIFYRTTEFLLEKPHRTRGLPSQDVKDQCDPWLFQAPAGSYQFEVRVRRPRNFEQLILDGIVDPELRVEQITKKFLEIVRATTQDPEGELIEVVPQEDYRETFLKLTRELAPPASGKSFDQMEIKSASDIDSQPVVLRPDTREAIKNVLKKPEMIFQEVPEHKIRQLRGTLRGLQLDKDWIELNINGKTETIYEAKEIDDVIGPMVDRRVVVEVLERSDRPVDKKYSLRDIQLEEDLL